jgi:hypothetical protein
MLLCIYLKAGYGLTRVCAVAVGVLTVESLNRVTYIVSCYTIGEVQK